MFFKETDRGLLSPDGYLSGEFEIGPFLNYGDLSRVLRESTNLFSSPEGARYLFEQRDELIGQLEFISRGRIIGIFSSGYPNYVAVPDFKTSPMGDLVITDQFHPVPEILNYVDKTLNNVEDHGAGETWPCPQCHKELGLKGLKANVCEVCGTTPTPFFLYTTIPDIDLYLVLRELQDAEQIISDARRAGIDSPENRMIETISEFPGSIHPDLHIVSNSDFLAGLKRIFSDKDHWVEVVIPVLHYYGSLTPGEIHLGLDFAFSLFPHLIADDNLRDTFFRARNQFVMNQDLSSIVAQLKETGSNPDLPQRIARLTSRYSTVEEGLRLRLSLYRDVGIDASIPNDGYIIVSSPDNRALYELYDSLAEREEAVFVVDECLLAFLGEYAPSFVAFLNESTGADYYNNQENVRTEQAAKLAMTHGALDNILFEGNTSYRLLRDRLKRLAKIMIYLGLPTENIDSYIDNLSEKDYAAATFFTKQAALDLFQYFDREPEGIQTLQLSANEYPFVDPLSKIIGDNLRAIVLYGSSTQLREGNDYDLLIFVDEISEQFYAELEDKQKEINTLCDRDVQLIVVPLKNLQTYLSLNTIPIEQMELVYGSALEMPRFSKTLDLEAAYQATRIVRSLGSMQFAFRDSAYYVQKPHVFHAHLKLPKYLIQIYEAIFRDRLPRDFFADLYSAFETPEFKKDLSPSEIKRLRVKTIHDLFMISQKVSLSIESD